VWFKCINLLRWIRLCCWLRCNRKYWRRADRKEFAKDMCQNSINLAIRGKERYNQLVEIYREKENSGSTEESMVFVMPVVRSLIMAISSNVLRGGEFS
jgi:hypothetical protein